MIILYILGFLFLLAAYKIDPKIIRAEKSAVLKFFCVMLIVTLIRFIIIKSSGSSPSSLDGFSVFSLSMVWWEDAVFVLPLLLLSSIKTKLRYLAPLTLLSSIVFAAGHVSQSLYWASFLLIYVYFISYKYGLKYGLGTVMVCHVMYDLITLLTSYLV